MRRAVGLPPSRHAGHDWVTLCHSTLTNLPNRDELLLRDVWLGHGMCENTLAFLQNLAGRCLWWCASKVMGSADNLGIAEGLKDWTRLDDRVGEI